MRPTPQLPHRQQRRMPAAHSGQYQWSSSAGSGGSMPRQLHGRQTKAIVQFMASTPCLQLVPAASQAVTTVPCLDPPATIRQLTIWYKKQRQNAGDSRKAYLEVDEVLVSWQCHSGAVRLDCFRCCARVFQMQALMQPDTQPCTLL